MKLSPLATGMVLGLVIGVGLGAGLLYLFGHERPPEGLASGPPAMPKGGMPNMKLAPVWGKLGDKSTPKPDEPAKP